MPQPPKAMRITIVNQTSVPDSAPGISRHHALAKALVRKGHSVTIVAGAFNHFTRKERPLPPGADQAEEVLDGVRFLWLRLPPYAQAYLPRLWSMVRFARSVSKLGGHACFTEADLIIGGTPYPTAALATMRLARRLGKPFVLEVRDVWPMTIAHLGGFSPWNPGILAFQWMEKALYKGAFWIISPLPGMNARIEEVLGVPNERFTWVPNGVETGFLAMPPPPPEDGPFEMLYAGLHSRQGYALGTILETAELLAAEYPPDKLRFTFLGDGPFKAEMMASAKLAGLTNVRFEDPVPKCEVYGRLGKANAFVHSIKDDPLYRFGLSMNKLFDYLSMARPVIFAGAPLNDVVQEAGAGLSVAAESPAEMAKAIRDVMSATAEQRALWGERGRQHILDHYTSDMLGGSLETVLLKLL